MTTEDKFKWLYERFSDEYTSYLGSIIVKAFRVKNINEENHKKLIKIYDSRKPYFALDLKAIHRIKDDNQLILTVELLYKLVRKHDLGRKT